MSDLGRRARASQNMWLELPSAAAVLLAWQCCCSVCFVCLKKSGGRECLVMLLALTHQLAYDCTLQTPACLFSLLILSVSTLRLEAPQLDCYQLDMAVLKEPEPRHDKHVWSCDITSILGTYFEKLGDSSENNDKPVYHYLFYLDREGPWLSECPED